MFEDGLGKWIFGGLATVIAFFGGTLLRRSEKDGETQWEAIEKLRSEINGLQLVVAGDYVKRAELVALEDRILKELRGLRSDVLKAVSNVGDTG